MLTSLLLCLRICLSVRLRSFRHFNRGLDPDPDAELIAELSQEAYNLGLLETICETLGYYDFESRKSVAIIFNGILHRQIGARTPTVDYIYHHQEILGLLLKGYGLMMNELLFLFP